MFTFMLGGCASSTTGISENAGYNPATHARIRLFGQNGQSTIMYSGIDCGAGIEGEKTNVGGGLGDALASLLLVKENEVLGIPPTEATKNLSKRDGILSKAFYKEIAIPAGKPVNLQTFPIEVLGPTPQKGQRVVLLREPSCTSPMMLSFIPEAGKDYEVLGAWANNEKCPYPVVFEVTQEADRVSTTWVQTSEEIKCK